MFPPLPQGGFSHTVCEAEGALRGAALSAGRSVQSLILASLDNEALRRDSLHFSWQLWPQEQMYTHKESLMRTRTSILR